MVVADKLCGTRRVQNWSTHRDSTGAWARSIATVDHSTLKALCVVVLIARCDSVLGEGSLPASEGCTTRVLWIRVAATFRRHFKCTLQAVSGGRQRRFCVRGWASRSKKAKKYTSMGSTRECGVLPFLLSCHVEIRRMLLRSFDELSVPLRSSRKPAAPCAHAVLVLVASEREQCCTGFPWRSGAPSTVRNQDFQMLLWDSAKLRSLGTQRMQQENSVATEREGRHHAAELEHPVVVTTTFAESATHCKIVKQHQMTLTEIMRVFRQTPQRPDSGTSLLYSNVFREAKSTSDCFPHAWTQEPSRSHRHNPLSVRGGGGGTRSNMSRTRSTHKRRKTHLSCQDATSSASWSSHLRSQTTKSRVRLDSGHDSGRHRLNEGCLH